MLAAPDEVLKHETSNTAATRPTDVGGARAFGDDCDGAPGIPQSTAEIGLLAVQPDPFVEPADGLERRATDEEAGSDDEAGTLVWEQPLDAEGFRPAVAAVGNGQTTR